MGATSWIHSVSTHEVTGSFAMGSSLTRGHLYLGTSYLMICRVSSISLTYPLGSDDYSIVMDLYSWKRYSVNWSI